MRMLCRKRQTRFRHCERSEAISITKMAFSVRHARDCHGPEFTLSAAEGGLAMTFCKSFLQINFEDNNGKMW